VNWRAVLTALWPVLRRLAQQIGRWILDVALEEGRAALAAYMRLRVGMFRRRQARARGAARRAWLDGRIRRWSKAAGWLESADGRRLTRKVASAAVERGQAELDANEPTAENFSRWKRDRERRRDRRRTRRAA
jgi:hypothetical protein